jgi:multicomponent Na+:H+ antiporter subunit B
MSAARERRPDTRSVLLRIAARRFAPFLLVGSVFVLLRGHNAPGGGFIGGLLAAMSYVLYAVATDVGTARRRLPAAPLKLAAAGTLTAVFAGLMSIAGGHEFLTGMWASVPMPVVEPLKLGTPLLFDAGVYVAVVGVVLTFVFNLAESV